mmetsp:Transcript_21452/g.39060  ORF Transcript_21452/g.39060 Transcript_21452/m.39060 type:complete len:97 (+) Transcript_21452:73-363(+)
MIVKKITDLSDKDCVNCEVIDDETGDENDAAFAGAAALFTDIAGCWEAEICDVATFDVHGSAAVPCMGIAAAPDDEWDAAFAGAGNAHSGGLAGSL